MSFIYSVKKERFRGDASIYEIGDYVAYKQGELENDAVAQVIGRTVEFIPSYRANMPMSLHMIQNLDGIWRVAFNPLQ